MQRLSISSFAVAAFLWVAQAATAADLNVDGVPIPSDVKIAARSSAAPESHKRFLGAWVGTWGGGLRHVLIVEDIRSDGEASVVYAIGDYAAANIKPAWSRHKARVSADTLSMGESFTATYKLADGDTLRATYQRGTVRSHARMAKIELAALTRPGAPIAWATGTVEFLNTGLAENGNRIHLEVVLFKPRGDGPFPLLVFNHGSTGRGTQPPLFAATWSSWALADFFVEKGWMVAFPQRRGRGKSDGLYDEGFAKDRAQGYACDPARSLPGADRALADIEAAVAALQRRSEVAGGRILIGGQSRGGVLSIAYAGKHPEQVLGVVNFVGGWLGEGCNTAAEINGALFARGGAGYQRPTLWLYGRGDSFYTMAHSRANYAVFSKAGGKGTFLELDVPGGANGHTVIGYPELWLEPVGTYLQAIGAPGKR